MGFKVKDCQVKNLNLFLELFKFYPNMQILEVGNLDENIKKILLSELDKCGGDLKHYKGELERLFEYVVISHDIEINEKILKDSYLKLETTADLIILLKKDSCDLWNLKELIGECGFTAVNDIDIFSEYDLIMAKKQEMWVRAY